MSPRKDFYDKQKDLTAAKIDFYEHYIETYLFKLLSGFGVCFIADLFCGTGENGEELGSPLVLVEKIKYVLTPPSLKSKNPKVYVLFNDENIKCVKGLTDKLESIELPNNIKISPVENKSFSEILKDIKEELKDIGDVPKFFFLDPFAYSNISVDNLKDLMALGTTEVLLFLPVFFAYRFKTAKFPPDHELTKFLEGFTTKGVYDYADIEDFNESIREKLSLELDTPYVRPVLLDAGPSKNALFLITKKRDGMLLMNKLAFDRSEDGSGINVRKKGVRTLFGLEEYPRYKAFVSDLENMIKKAKMVSSDDIIEFTIRKTFLPKHAKEVMQKLQKRGIVKITENGGNSTKQFYIAEKPKGKSLFHYTKRHDKKKSKTKV